VKLPDTRSLVYPGQYICCANLTTNKVVNFYHWCNNTYHATCFEDFLEIFHEYSKNISHKAITKIVKKHAGVAHVIPFPPPHGNKFTHKLQMSMEQVESNV
jgi:hypothetical protein